MTVQTHKTKKATAQSLSKGFTLIELLVVIGILAILLAITLIAINPARQFAQANNTKRSSDINAILNAIGQFQADNNGALPGNMPAPGAAAEAVANTGADICADLVTQYMAALPQDPSSAGGAAITNCGAAYNTGYEVSVSAADNRVTVTAPSTEIPPATADFTVTR